MIQALLRGLVGLVGATLPTATPAAAQDDHAVRRTIDRIRAATPGLTVDGRDGDWEAVPAVADPTGEVARPALDLTSVALVPTDEALLVRLTTAGRPDRSDRVFWLDVDVTGGRLPDLQVGLSDRGDHAVRLFDGAGRPRALRRAPFPAAVGDVVEVALPMELLEAMLPDAGALRGPDARGWVRVTAFTWRRGDPAPLDVASAASYRIVAGSYPLDPPLPAGGGPSVSTRLPVDGRWLVSQGPLGYATHATSWAWDLTVADNDLAGARPRDACANEAFFAWDRPVRAPAAGRVVRTVDGSPDASPCARPSNAEPNGVALTLADGGRLWLAHLRRGSVVAQEGEAVVPGALLGRVGNSGRSVGPHLHVEAFAAGDAASGTLELRDVRVSLNATPDDPWARTLDRWVPRPGFFVEPAPGRQRKNR